MALPGDLTTTTITFGPYTDAAGVVVLVGAKGKLFPVDPSTNRRIRLTHVTSGQAILPKPVEITVGEDGTASLPGIPHTGQATLSPTGYAWRVEWSLQTGDKHPSPGNLTFVVPSGASADFDLLVPAPNLPTISVAAATSVNGQTGTVVLDAADVGAQPAATLAADTAGHVSDGSALDVALKAAFAPAAVSLSSLAGVRSVTPTLQKYAGNPIWTVAQSASTSIYHPCIRKVEGVLASPIDKWYMWFSTNHDATIGGIYLATAPSPAGPWTQYGTGPVYVDTVVGNQTETPDIQLDPGAPTGEKVKLYYQNSSLGASQSTHMAMGDDGINFTRYTATVPILLGSVTENPGDGHTGYFHVYRFGGLWFGYSLNGGGNNPHFALWRGRDGKNWQRDPRQLHRDLGRLFVWRGELWGANTRTTGISGPNPGTMLGWRLQRVADDLRHGLGTPIDFTLPQQTWEDGAGQLPGSPVADDDGTLYVPYYNLPNRGFGLLKVVQS